ncbi:hypothetical protein FJT64_022720 [Amphibalanus amphitrite]|uniref:Uncharacterized protein n=1 Tax=Amphibalanus amphitrite TaxID=1232801 RepID=A0A6A4WTX1_AMPAM|nr:hypothetical protein FJT64_022720 [Amphibalanus amphitrite]
METVLASLGLGTRYCLVSDDHERPEPYAADDHERGPPSLRDRCTESGGGGGGQETPTPSGGRSGSGSGGGLLGRLRQQREQRANRPLNDDDDGTADVKKPSRRERAARAASAATEKENAGPRPDATLGLFERLASRHSEGRLSALGGLRPGSRGDQGSAPLMSGDNGGDSWGWSSSPSKTSPSTDAQWGSGAAWDDAQIAAPKTKAAKEAKSRTKKAGGSDQKSLIDLGGESKEDEWQSWEDDAWASLERK